MVEKIQKKSRFKSKNLNFFDDKINKTDEIEMIIADNLDWCLMDFYSPKIKADQYKMKYI